MSTPYSYGLRAKVVQAIDEGMTKTEASRVFKLSRNTINLWLKRRKEIGDYKAKVGYQKGYRPNLNKIEHYWFPIKNRVRKTEGTIEDSETE